MATPQVIRDQTKQVNLLQQESTDEAILYKERSTSASPMGDNATMKKCRRCPVLLEFISSFEDIFEETVSSKNRGQGGKSAEGMQQEKEKKIVTTIDDKN